MKKTVKSEPHELISDEMSKTIIYTAEKIAISEGAENLTVRKILQSLDITNRVFYNRFHNIDEVLNLVYEGMVLKIRESITADFDPQRDFFEQVLSPEQNKFRLKEITDQLHRDAGYRLAHVINQIFK